FVTGEQTVIHLCEEAGIDAILVVDLPPEEGRSLRRAAADAGIAVIPLVAPTSDADRVEVILREATREPGAKVGFIYLVSMTGVTGAVAPDLAEARRRARDLAERSGWPVVVGFGIDGPERAREVIGPPRSSRFDEAPVSRPVPHGPEGPDGVVV